MKKYLLKTTSYNTETSEIQIFYTGKDGYVHDEETRNYADGYKLKALVENKMKREINWTLKFYKDSVQLKDNLVFNGKWIERYEIVEIEQEDE